MTISIVRNYIMPVVATGLLATGVSACNNLQKEKLEDAREAIEYTKKFGKDGATILAFYDVYDLDALDAVQEDIDNKTKSAFMEFEDYGKKTRYDSIYMSGIINDREETKIAIQYLKEQAASVNMTEAEIICMYDKLHNKQEPTLTAKELDSITEANIQRYKHELLNNQ